MERVIGAVWPQNNSTAIAKTRCNLNPPPVIYYRELHYVNGVSERVNTQDVAWTHQNGRELVWTKASLNYKTQFQKKNHVNEMHSKRTVKLMEAGKRVIRQ